MKLVSRKGHDPFKSSKRESFLDVSLAGGASALVSEGMYSCGPSFLLSSVSYGVLMIGLSARVGYPGSFQLESLHSVKPAKILLNKVIPIGS